MALNKEQQLKHAAAVSAHVKSILDKYGGKLEVIGDDLVGFFLYMEGSVVMGTVKEYQRAGFQHGEKDTVVIHGSSDSIVSWEDSADGRIEPKDCLDRDFRLLLTEGAEGKFKKVPEGTRVIFWVNAKLPTAAKMRGDGNMTAGTFWRTTLLTVPPDQPFPSFDEVRFRQRIVPPTGERIASSTSESGREEAVQGPGFAEYEDENPPPAAPQRAADPNHRPRRATK